MLAVQLSPSPSCSLQHGTHASLIKALPRKVSRIILVRDHDRERSSQLRADLGPPTDARSASVPKSPCSRALVFSLEETEEPDRSILQRKDKPLRVTSLSPFPCKAAPKFKLLESVPACGRYSPRRTRKPERGHGYRSRKAQRLPRHQFHS